MTPKEKAIEYIKSLKILQFPKDFEEAIDIAIKKQDKISREKERERCFKIFKQWLKDYVPSHFDKGFKKLNQSLTKKADEE